ncbi:MAG TPA: hypothetical protein VHU89_01505 [Acidobacteriaceae bacterium]|nr:hypothetical protein [Acidobacteriaceae bacterium]
MAKRRSVEDFSVVYSRLVKLGKLREFEAYLEKYKFTEAQKRIALDQFKRDAEMVLRSSGRF